MFWLLLNLAIVIGIGVYVYLFAWSRVTAQSTQQVSGSVPTPIQLKGPDGPTGPNGTLRKLPQKEQDDIRNEMIKRWQLRDQMLGFVEQYVLPAILVLTWVYGLRVYDLKYSILLGSVLAMTYVAWVNVPTTDSEQEVIFHLFWVIITVYIFSRYGAWAALIPFGIVIASFARTRPPSNPTTFQIDKTQTMGPEQRPEMGPEQRPFSLRSLLFLLGLALLVVLVQQLQQIYADKLTLETRIKTLQESIQP